MSEFTESVSRQIHASGHRLVLCLTGGGSSAIGELLEIPGASRSVLEGIVPYSAAALDEFLGGPPENYCSEWTARLMAMGAFERGRGYLSSEFVGGNESTPGELPTTAGPSPEVKKRCSDRLAGIGCTASLASDRPKRGAHRAFVAVQTAAHTASVSLELTKDARSRREEEALVAALVLNTAAESCGLADRVPIALLPGETPIRQRTDAPPAWRELLWGDRRAVCQSGSAALPGVLFPGSFHPRHEAHCGMAQIAGELLGQPVAYELSISNVDKPPLDYREIELRAAGFAADETLWLTRAPTFIEKVELFPGATFVVGLDTIRRIAETRYYGGDEAQRDRAVAQLAAGGSKFLVFGRMEQGQFQTLNDLTLPTALKALCRGVPAEQFRCDVSSTELRRES